MVGWVPVGGVGFADVGWVPVGGRVVTCRWCRVYRCRGTCRWCRVCRCRGIPVGGVGFVDVRVGYL